MADCETMRTRRGVAAAAAPMIMAIGLAACGDDSTASADAQATVTVTETVTEEAAPEVFEGAGEPEDDDAGSSFGTIQELGEAVCDPGTFKDTGDDYDFPCEIDGQRVLLTDWSTFGGAPEDGPGKLSVNEVFGIQGPPATIEVARERLGM